MTKQAIFMRKLVKTRNRMNQEFNLKIYLRAIVTLIKSLVAAKINKK